MAYDYGSIDLGLKNPFKIKGFASAIKGAAQLIIGLIVLRMALSSVTEDAVKGWILLVLGILIFAVALKAIGGGLYATMRFFVGRNHPTSLAKNFSSAAADISAKEAAWVAYNAQNLESMLAARKNSSFLEPRGFIARLLYTIFPKLLFMPYPIRNYCHQLTEAWVRTILLLISYAMTSFVCLGGFAGTVGELLYPFSTLILSVGMIYIWFRKASFINRDAELRINGIGGKNIMGACLLGIAAPLIPGLFIKISMEMEFMSAENVSEFINVFMNLNPQLFMAMSVYSIIVVSALTVFRLRPRLKEANPVTEVSELRTNWQNTVHPRDIFINIDNDIMARRRYKEAPNRVYKQLNPQLQEQVNGKGTFSGELMQEVQPRVLDTESNIKQALLWQLGLLAAGNALLILTTIFLVISGFRVVDFSLLLRTFDYKEFEFLEPEVLFPILEELMVYVYSAVRFLAAGIILTSTAHWVLNLNHVMIAEIRFESLLIYFRCQGTFTESKISTGMSIHDSLRSENVQVRSSISPWLMVSRLVTSTYAGTGLNNLEHSRYIMEMYKDDDTLDSICMDLEEFFGSRETLAGINNKKDVANAAMINQINRSSRSRPSVASIEGSAPASRQLAGPDDSDEDAEPAASPKKKSPAKKTSSAGKAAAPKKTTAAKKKSGTDAADKKPETAARKSPAKKPDTKAVGNTKKTTAAKKKSETGAAEKTPKAASRKKKSDT